MTLVEFDSKNVVNNKVKIGDKEYTVTDEVAAQGHFYMPTVKDVVVKEKKLNFTNQQKAAGNASSRAKILKKPMKKLNVIILSKKLLKTSIENLIDLERKR